MQFYKCSSKTEIIEPHLHCPTCQKYYLGVSIIHICNREMPCTRRRDPPTPGNITARCVEIGVKYEDKICLECIERERAANAPTYNTCTGCGYQGWFKPDDLGRCPGCVASAGVVVEAPAVAVPTSAPVAAPRKRRPIGTVEFDQRKIGYRPTNIEFVLKAFSDTTEIRDYGRTIELREEDYTDDGNVRYDKFITKVIAAKKRIEDTHPGIIWIDIPMVLKMYLEDLAADNGLTLTF